MREEQSRWKPTMRSEQVDWFPLVLLALLLLLALDYHLWSLL